MQVSLPRAQAYDLSSLNGSYADSLSGFAPLSPGGPNRPVPIDAYGPVYEAGLYTFDGAGIDAYGPVYEAGLYTFDGAGSFTASLVFNFGGGVILNASWSQNVTGTYTVNANGTGTMTLTGNHRRHFVIGDGGNELKYVGTDPTGGIVVGGSMVKQ